MAEKVTAIIGARLNSSRLPGKQLLDLAGKPMIGRLLDRIKSVPEIDQIALATTADDYNADLLAWGNKESIKSYGYTGDIDDLMGRVDYVFSDMGGDILVYVCGDSPLIEPSTLSRLVKALKNTPEAEIPVFAPREDGNSYIHEGFGIYRRDFWHKMMAQSQEPFEREHVGAVHHALGKVCPDHVAEVVEPDIYAALDHRISVDTPSDYRFVLRLYNRWYENHLPSSLVSLQWVISELLADPALWTNSHVHQKTVHERSKKALLVTEAGEQCGFGHLSRMIAAAAALQDQLAMSVRLAIVGEPFEREDLSLLVHEFIKPDQVGALLDGHASALDLIVVDMPEGDALDLAARAMANSSPPVILVDKGPEIMAAALYFFPSHYRGSLADTPKTSFGWENYLLPEMPVRRDNSNDGNRVLVLTGAGDVDNLGAIWPKELVEALPNDAQINWVKGPYAAAPATDAAWANFHILESPKNLVQRLAEFDVALCIHGVSLFECMAAGLPTVAVWPNGRIVEAEWNALKEYGLCEVAKPENAALALTALYSDVKMRSKLSQSAQTAIEPGCHGFVQHVRDLMEKKEVLNGQH